MLKHSQPNQGQEHLFRFWDVEIRVILSLDKLPTKANDLCQFVFQEVVNYTMQGRSTPLGF